MKNLITFLLVIISINTYSQIDFINHLIIDKTQSIGAIGNTIVVDIDGDGWNDIISSSYYGSRIVWQKNLDGLGEFSKIKNISSNIEKPNISIGDIDGDGDIDLFATSSYSDVLSVFKNDGYGNFTRIIVDSNISFYSVTPYDVDNDGDLDLVTSQYEYPEIRIYWYENTNSDSFQKHTLLDSRNSFKMIDLDNDGDLDILSTIIVTDEYIDYVWYKNIDGQGNYGDSILLHHHEPTTYEWLNYVKNGFYTSDIDDDGDIDIFIVTTGGISLITNQGNGNFSNANLILTNGGSRVKTIKFNDIDNDGDLDLVVTSINWQNDSISWYENIDGNGTFNTVYNLITNSINGVRSIDIKDIDQDNELDIIAGTSGDDKLVWFKNLGDGMSFSNEKQISIKILEQDYINVIDTDNDGDKDILMLSENSVVMHENLDGLGNMSLQRILKLDNLQTIYTGDLDNDGDIDIFGKHNNDIIWYENLGNNNFSNLQTILLNSNHSNGKMILFDYDNDGDNDILKTFYENSSTGGLEMIENLGNGNFSDVNVFYNAGTNGVQNLDLKDIDGDGDKDIFISIYNNNNHSYDKISWFENTDGNGSFGTPTTIYSNTVTSSFLVDLDNDGDLDIVSGKNYFSSKFIGWQENDGAGNFSSMIYIINNDSDYKELYVSDIDNDGDLDILRYYGYDGLTWFENDGFATFFPNSPLMSDINISKIIATKDINNDNSLDIITYNYDDKSISWFENRGIVKNRINGVVKFDFDSNGCDGADINLENIKIETTNGTETYTTFTNVNGYYQTNPIEEGSFTTAVSNLPSYFSATPNSYSSNFVGVGNIDVNDFCVVSSQSVNDLNVILIPLTEVRPGFSSRYRIKVNNIGSTQLSGNVVFDFDGSKLSFVSASQSVSTQTSDSVTFDFQDLNPFNGFIIDVKLQAFTPPILQIGEVLNYTATVNPTSDDLTPNNNIFTLNQTSIGSYDPNDITVLEGHQVLYEDADEFLHYIIRFQNTGTADAINILVENSLDTNLDGSTFEIIDSSHNCITEIVNNEKVSFTFENIHLPDSTSDELNSNGFIAYKIKPKQGVNVDDVIFNTAEIYFDYNPAIITNTAWTEFKDLLLVDNNEKIEFAIYPVPVNDFLKIESDFKIKAIQIYNSLSQKIIQKEYSNSINLSTLTKGIYYVRLEDVNGNISVKRIIKN